MTATVQIFPSLLSISAPFQGVLLDAYGVFWGGNEVGLFPGALETMEQLVLQGKVVGILSNSSQLVAKEREKFQRHGLVQGRHFHFLLTSGEVARSLFLQGELPFATPQNRFWAFGGGHPKFSSYKTLFEGTKYTETTDIAQADFGYLSIPHLQGEDQTDPEVFRDELEKVKARNLPLVCANPDRFAHEGNPSQAVVRQGSLARMYEEMGGQVFYIGKPHPYVYSMAFQEFQKQKKIADPADILMVGDTPETDIQGARHFGMASALVTRTGIMADRIAEQGQDQAFRTLNMHDTPEYFLEQLADDSLRVTS